MLLTTPIQTRAPLSTHAPLSPEACLGGTRLLMAARSACSVRGDKALDRGEDRIAQLAHVLFSAHRARAAIVDFRLAPPHAVHERDLVQGNTGQLLCRLRHS